MLVQVFPPATSTLPLGSLVAVFLTQLESARGIAAELVTVGAQHVRNHDRLAPSERDTAFPQELRLGTGGSDGRSIR